MPAIVVTVTGTGPGAPLGGEVVMIVFSEVTLQGAPAGGTTGHPEDRELRRVRLRRAAGKDRSDEAELV